MFTIMLLVGVLVQLNVMEFLTVTPGIRLASDSVNDQKRVTTPAMAKELTSSYIVVGRTITGSQDPLATYKKVYQDFQGE